MNRDSKKSHLTQVMTHIAELIPELSAPQLAYLEQKLEATWERGHAEGYILNQQLHIDLIESADRHYGEPRYVEREYRNKPGGKLPWNRNKR